MTQLIFTRNTLNGLNYKVSGVAHKVANGCCVLFTNVTHEVYDHIRWYPNTDKDGYGIDKPMQKLEDFFNIASISNVFGKDLRTMQRFRFRVINKSEDLLFCKDPKTGEYKNRYGGWPNEAINN